MKTLSDVLGNVAHAWKEFWKFLRASGVFRILFWFYFAQVQILALGGLLYLYTNEALSEEQQEEVLVKAIPFVTIFVVILLIYIYLIVFFAIVLEGRVPQRSYYPLERVIIVGIGVGAVGLFQPWRQGGFEYGFVLLLISLLFFIAWSHIQPGQANDSPTLRPLSQQAHTIGAITGILVAAIFALTVSNSIIQNTKPEAPYGVREQIWNSRIYGEEKRAAVAEAAEDRWNTMKPFYLFVSLLPGAMAYFIGREVAALRDDATESSNTHSMPELTTDPAPG